MLSQGVSPLLLRGETMKTYTVVLSGYARHNGIRYKTGEEITGLTGVEVKRLQRARVVAEVREEAVEPTTPPEGSSVTLDDITGANAKGAIEVIEQATDIDVLKAVIELDERTTVKAAAEKRLAELTEAE